MKILNLYAGIGGNRKLWGDEYEITAVEYKQEIADIYHDFFPKDKIIVTDAHQYLLEHFKEYDFIWSSPPCPSHSKVRKATTHQNPPIYPDMKLYEEILFLQGYFKGKWCVENVIAWYKPLIASYEFEKHWWWANFVIAPFNTKQHREHDSGIKILQERKGFNLKKYTNIDKRIILRNCVELEIGLHILQCAMGLNKQKILL